MMIRQRAGGAAGPDNNRDEGAQRQGIVRTGARRDRASNKEEANELLQLVSNRPAAESLGGGWQRHVESAQ